MIPIQYALRRRMMAQGGKKKWKVTVTGNFVYTTLKNTIAQASRFNIGGTWYPVSPAGNAIALNYTQEIEDGDVIQIYILPPVEPDETTSFVYIVDGVYHYKVTANDFIDGPIECNAEYVVHSDITLEGVGEWKIISPDVEAGIRITSV